jgi:hypothetical protein
VLNEQYLYAHTPWNIEWDPKPQNPKTPKPLEGNVGYEILIVKIKFRGAET